MLGKQLDGTKSLSETHVTDHELTDQIIGAGALQMILQVRGHGLRRTGDALALLIAEPVEVRRPLANRPTTLGRAPSGCSPLKDFLVSQPNIVAHCRSVHAALEE
ncbi:MAG: hypothetical protein JWL84_5099 [Rhodospirillales bacterium]|nr:hypothetical protein [Rhodospirillales bacterium]